MSEATRNRLIEIVAALFILLFLYTALDKLSSRRSYEVVLAKSPLIGNRAAVFSWLIPVTEIAVAVLLFVPVLRKVGLLSTLGMLIAFTAYIVYMIIYTPKLPCSCGGFIGGLSWRQHLWFNGGLILLAACGVFLSWRNQNFIAINRGSRKPV